MSDPLDIRPDDLQGAATRALIRDHLRQMREISPEESCHALDVDALVDPSITVWSAWVGDELAGVGALAMMDARNAEIKSMRVAAPFLGRGVGRALLTHITAIARERGVEALWLETGSTPEFHPAVALYESAGFTRCAPFGTYVVDPYSIFLTRRLTAA